MTVYASPRLAALAQQAVVVTEVVEVTVERAPAPPPVAPVAARTDLIVAECDWTWEQLRDYVVAEITKVIGPFHRDVLKEAGIFKGFLNRYGADAPRIAKAAFEVYRGYWRSAPISVTRFTKGNDDYFAGPILQALNA